MSEPRYYHPIQAARARVILSRAARFLVFGRASSPPAAILAAHKSTGYPVWAAMAAWREAGNLIDAPALVKDGPAPVSPRDQMRALGLRR